MKKWILGSIIVVSLILRLINLNISPPGFNADEAALGYNAYSILKTGKDEWGTPFPIVFKSFSDYKPGLYVYLDVPFIAVMGLNEISVRLPSVLLGTLTILLIYLLSLELFHNDLIAFSSAFLLAISPWHLLYSRGAWEANVATFLMTLGVLAFLRGFNTHKWLWVSLVSLILSMYTYQSTRLVVPALTLLLILFYRKKLLVKKNLSLVIVGFILVLPLLFLSFSQQGLSRFEGLSIFNDPGPGLRVNVDRGQYQNPAGLSAIIFHNKILAYGISFLGHYLDHFSPSFLFTNGDPLGRNKVPEMGQLYLFEIGTLLVGLFQLYKYPKNQVIFFWLAVAPLAAALTYQTPSALRAENMVIPTTLISGLGLGFVIESIYKKTSIWWPALILSCVAVLFFIARFLDLYFVHLPKEYPLEWEYGFSQMVDYIQSFEADKVKITDRYDQAYILVLFYTKYDPAKYQTNFKQEAKTQYGFSTVTSFDKYQFGPVAPEEIGKGKNTIYVGLDNLKQSDKTIYFPSGGVAFKIARSP